MQKRDHFEGFRPLLNGTFLGESLGMVGIGDGQ